MNVLNNDYKHTEDIELWDLRKKLEQSEFKYQSTHLLHNMRHPLEGEDDLTANVNFRITA